MLYRVLAVSLPSRYTGTIIQQVYVINHDFKPSYDRSLSFF